MSSFCKCKSYSHFFSKYISIYAIFNNQRFNDMLINDTVSFEQLGSDYPLLSRAIKCISVYLQHLIRLLNILSAFPAVYELLADRPLPGKEDYGFREMPDTMVVRDNLLLGQLFPIEPKCTYTKISLRLFCMKYYWPMKFLKVVVYVIIIDQWYQTTC